ncbi:inhibin beta C chain [Salarias fasciatus]|uniref:Inhibin beta C chain-like n=1 Tax=Salarias fasciatus TaxID=181472 RepID=A0A672IIH3_SALFA|nr:inhibin beta C chain-like [Salarias fasciatus]
MLTSHTLLRLISCTLLHLSSTSGENWLHVPHEDTPGVDRVQNQRTLLLEAVRTGILSSLDMDKEPRPTRKVSEGELRRMFQLYWEKMREMRGNSSETRQSLKSTVLFPETVEQLPLLRRRQILQSGQRVHRYRAVFHRNPNIQSELSLAQAELKISSQSLDKLSLLQPEVTLEVKVNVNGIRKMIFSALAEKDSVFPSSDSSSQDVLLDISSTVDTWLRTGGQSLVVDLGIVETSKDTVDANANISVELILRQESPEQKTRLRRSNKEEECDERGWCCRKSVTVSFKEIGWTDWVVAPEEYTMQFCDGSCPHNYKPASMHTQVKSRMHQITKGGTPRPCCVPAAYEPMVIMHYDSRGNLKLTPFNDFIVTKCHCA